MQKPKTDTKDVTTKETVDAYKTIVWAEESKGNKAKGSEFTPRSVGVPRITYQAFVTDIALK